MRTPDEVAAMLRLHGLGWGTRRIAAEVGCNRETVQRYLASGRWRECQVPARPNMLAGHADWIAERLRRHRGNADVVRQELASELGVVASLRTVERSVLHLRRELAAAALATVRFETPPGRQLQIDFGQRRIAVEGCEGNRVYLFVATLGYSRRVYAQAFTHERQSAWLEGIEGAFRHFGGLPGELLLDNATALVKHHDAATREVEFNARLAARARGSAGAAAFERPTAVPATARAGPQGSGRTKRFARERRLRGRGHEPLQRALAADWRLGQRGGQRRQGPHPPCRRRGGLP